MEKISIEKISNVHNEWLQSLGFYKDEIAYFKTRLTEIAQKNTGKDTLKQIEHFENQFKIQTSNIEELQHDINEYVADTAKEAQNANAGYVDKTLAGEQLKLSSRYHMLMDIFNELKQSFTQFSAEWM